jgi:hypothetical protein
LGGFLLGKNACRQGYVWRRAVEKLLIAAALACQPGDRAIDLSGKLPRGLQYVELIVSVEPFYTRLYIYQPGYPDSFQQCCNNKPTSVLRVPIGTGLFCVRQSQPQMKWHLRGVARPDIEM